MATREEREALNKEYLKVNVDMYMKKIMPQILKHKPTDMIAFIRKWAVHELKKKTDSQNEIDRETELHNKRDITDDWRVVEDPVGEIRGGNEVEGKMDEEALGQEEAEPGQMREEVEQNPVKEQAHAEEENPEEVAKQEEV